MNKKIIVWLTSLLLFVGTASSGFALDEGASSELINDTIEELQDKPENLSDQSDENEFIESNTFENQAPCKENSFGEYTDNEITLSACNTYPTFNVTKNGKSIFSPGELRTKACQHMFDMSNVGWTINKSVSYTPVAGSDKKTLKAGKYKGIPYTQGKRDYSLTSKVQERMTAAANGNGEVYGVDCSSAASFALRYATGNTDSNNYYCKGASGTYVGSCFLYDGMTDSAGTATSLKGKTITYRNNLKKVGDYGTYTGYKTAGRTDTILKKLSSGDYYSSGDVYSNIYSKIRPGDVLVQYYKYMDADKEKFPAHIMMAVRVKNKYVGTKIDPDNSYVYIIDQISPDVSVYETGEKSSWRNDKTHSTSHDNAYTFRELAEKKYFLPVTAFNTSYTVKYNANGGTNAPDSQTKSAYSPLKLSTLKPSRTGYSFVCWDTITDPIETTYMPGDTYREDNSETMTARWSANKYTISYNANGGSGAPGSQVKTYAANMYLKSEAPYREGYVFKGWARTSTAISKEYDRGQYLQTDLSTTANANVTLYAVWEKHEHDFIHHEGKEAECTTDGNKEYWECSSCGNCYFDEQGTEPAYDGAQIIKAPGHSLTHYSTPRGYLQNGIEYDLCDVCSIELNKTVIKGYANLYAISYKLYRGKRNFKAKWSKRSSSIQKKFNGYQIRYSRNSDMSNAKYCTANKSSGGKTIKNLKTKKRYYVQVRTYTKSNGITFYSRWSTKKSIKTR